MKTAEFDYVLPEQLIAQTPADKRENSRLLVSDGEKILHKKFSDIIDFINSGDLLVFNDTKVIPAGLLGKKISTGGNVEVLLLSQVSENVWETLVNPARRLKLGQLINFNDNELLGEIVEELAEGKRLIKFSFQGNFFEVLNKIGVMPLPPYIKLENEEFVKKRYQTVYAKNLGAVAAPTAGLHFSPELLEKLKIKGVNFAYVTLHVGIGTFRPVEVDEVKTHEMHAEKCILNQETIDLIKKTKDNKKRVIAVGTTSTRLLEGIYNKYQKLVPVNENINIFITPGFKFRVVDELITNFHLPKSTLLMMVSAFKSRDKIFKLYGEAIKEKYRFFSFGDAVFLK